jgi:hypothetical protein
MLTGPPPIVTDMWFATSVAISSGVGMLAALAVILIGKVKATQGPNLYKYAVMVPFMLTADFDTAIFAKTCT